MEKLIITKKNGYVVSSLFDEKELVLVQAEKMEQESILGNIYIGKVKNIVKNINAAFLELSNGIMAYYSLTKKEQPVFVKRSSQNKICIGDEFLVQVERENVKTKQPVVTANFSLTGKYLVLLHDGTTAVHISTKIKKKDEAEQLRNLFAETTRNYSLIVRTNAANADTKLLKQEEHRLALLYEQLCTQGIHKNCFSLLYQTPPTYLQQIRDEYTNKLSAIITDEPDLYDSIRTYISDYQPEDLGKLSLYENTALSLSALYGLGKKLEEIQRELVWLKSGANIVIQPTEALTVIDVNTGKAIAGKTAVAETFLKINKEAAVEIVKQIRLRNLSGIIIIDFIDLEQPEAEQELLHFLSELCSKDPIKTTVVDMTALHLVEITRKKVRKPFYEQVGADFWKDT